jgi:integrase/recombinase XerD
MELSIQTLSRKNYKSIYLVSRVEGMDKPKWENTGLRLYGDHNDSKVWEVAKDILAKRRIDIIEGRYDVIRVEKQRNFVDYYGAICKEKPDYERKASVHKHLLSFNPDLKFGEVNETFWNNFKSYLIEQKGYQQGTIYTTIILIRSVLNRAVRDKIINVNPLKGIKEKRPKSTRNFLTIEEVRKLQDTPCSDNEVKKAFLFACRTTLRLSDIEALRKSHIVNDEIIIKMEKTDDYVRIPLDGNIYPYLPNLDTLQEDDLLFNLPARSTVSVIIKAWTKAAGLNKHITFHSSRHTAATLLLQSSNDIVAVQELLGHKDLRTTRIYAKLLDESKRKAINSLPSFIPKLIELNKGA